MLENPLYIAGMLCLAVLSAEWLATKTWLRHLGTALVVILLVAVLSNSGLMPSSSKGSGVYQGIFQYVAPLAIFFLLLDVNLESLRKAGTAMLILFAIGSIGTVLGVITGMWMIRGADHFQEFYPALGGMFTGTYTGGSINFNAVALHYQIMDEGLLYAGATAVDNIVSALWMVVTLLVPNLIGNKNKLTPISISDKRNGSEEIKEESINITSISILGSLGLFSLLISDAIAIWSRSINLPIPSILILTTIALILAQIPAVHRLRGGHILGLFCIYLFLAVIGAYCEIAAMMEIGDLAWRLLALVLIIVTVHGLWLSLFVWLGKFDIGMASVASQANIGGSSSALALAKSINRMDLYLPGILLGALGNGLGTYLGFLVAAWLG